MEKERIAADNGADYAVAAAADATDDAVEDSDDDEGDVDADDAGLALRRVVADLVSGRRSREPGIAED